MGKMLALTLENCAITVSVPHILEENTKLACSNLLSALPPKMLHSFARSCLRLLKLKKLND